MFAIHRDNVTVEQQNDLVRQLAMPGRGIFVCELQRALQRRRIVVPFLAHDLLAELDGRPSNVQLGQPRHPSASRPENHDA